MPVKKESKDIKIRDTSIYYEKSVTKNLGNYESAKITVGVTLPINPTKEELEAVDITIRKADILITKELIIQIDEITGK